MYSHVNLPPDSASRLHAAVARLVEERVVHVLGHQREHELVRLRRGQAGERAEQGCGDAVPINSFFIA